MWDQPFPKLRERRKYFSEMETVCKAGVARSWLVFGLSAINLLRVIHLGVIRHLSTAERRRGDDFPRNKYTAGGTYSGFGLNVQSLNCH